MLFKALLLLSLILQLPTEPGNGLPAQAGKDEHVKDESGKFLIVPPTGWKKVEKYPLKVILAYREDKKEFASNFTVREVTMADQVEPKPSEIMEAIKKRYLEAKYTIVDEPTVPEINGRPASSISYTFERQPGKGKEKKTDKMYGMTYLVLSPNKSVYLVTFTMADDAREREKLKQMALASVKSIQLKKE